MTLNKRRTVWILFLVGIIILFMITNILKDTNIWDPVTSIGKARNNKHVKRILFTTHWWQAHFPFIKETNAFCPRCVFTESETEWELSDAVIFHGRMLNTTVPKCRPKGQIWVFMLFETMSNPTDKDAFSTAILYDEQFNWTLTYRRDSDVFTPYGRFVEISSRPRPNITETWAFIPGALGGQTYANDSFVVTPSIQSISKRKMVAWITSRCESPSKRELIVEELSKYMQVDIYGNCGRLKCKVPKEDALTGVDCRMQIAKKYKFYLAFENSVCEDYVTEKFFDTALTEMVPVVYGGSDYPHMFPEKSFINVADFNSVKELAEYLLFLNSNVTEYLKYFEWRKSYWVQTNRFVTGFCSLCDKLWVESESQQVKETKVYENIFRWWTNSKEHLLNHKLACSDPEVRFRNLFSNLTKSITK